MHHGVTGHVSQAVGTGAWGSRFTFAAASIMVGMMVVSGCSLGHEQFKEEHSAEVPADKACRPFEEVFKVDGGAGNRLRLTDAYLDASLIPNVCVERKPNEGSGMSLAVIEFDDEGNHWNRSQFDIAMKEIERISDRMKEMGNDDEQTKGVEERVQAESIFLVVYVHGWRTNSSENRETLSMFRWFVRELARSDETCLRTKEMQRAQPTSDGASELPTLPCKSRPHVFGVYISWRGDAVGEFLRKVPGVEYLTFWNRQAAARRIAGTAVTETLLGLLNKIEEKDRERFETRSLLTHATLDASTAPPRSRSLIIGHSMGARILEHAFSQAFLAKRLEARRFYGERLLRTLKEVGSEKEELEDLQRQWDNLDKQLEEATKVVGELDSSIEESTKGILEKELERSDIPLSLDDEKQLRVYAGTPKPKVDQLNVSCGAYDESGVGKCVSDSTDVRVLAHCAAMAVQCLYESYRCSINRLISSLSEAEKSECSGRFIDDDTIFSPQPSEDDIGKWAEFARDIEQEEGKVPEMLLSNGNGERGKAPPPDKLPTISEILRDERLFDRRIELVAAMSHWSNHLRPFNFDPNSPGWEDVTENADERLTDALGVAKKDIRNRLEADRRHLRKMQEVWSQLDEREAIEQEIRNLRDRKAQQETERDEAKRRLIRASVLRGELHGQVVASTDNLTMLAGQLPFELDGALHPPANLILLLNAATEAMSARNLIHAMCTTESTVSRSLGEVQELLPKINIDIPETHQPWLVSVTSKGDRATKALFPIGVRLGRLFSGRANREFAEAKGNCEHYFGTYGDLAAHTAGHQDLLWSHEVNQLSKECDPNKFNRISESDKSNAFSFCVNGKEFEIRQREEQPRPDGGRQYWITQVPEEIIKGHTDVITPQTLELARGLLEYTELFVSWCPKYNQVTGECEMGHKAEEQNRP